LQELVWKGEIQDSEEERVLKDLNKYSTKIKIINSEKKFASLSLEYLRANFNTKYTGSFIGLGLPYGSLVSSTKNKIQDFLITVADGLSLTPDLKTYYSLVLD
jgi:hypothetical protein